MEEVQIALEDAAPRTRVMVGPPPTKRRYGLVNGERLLAWLAGAGSAAAGAILGPSKAGSASRNAGTAKRELR
jgi:hypothetical protein